MLDARMPLDVVVVMDPVGSIKPAKDSTFAMLLEAQRRGHRLHYVLPGSLAVDAGRAQATTVPAASWPSIMGSRTTNGPILPCV